LFNRAKHLFVGAIGPGIPTESAITKRTATLAAFLVVQSTVDVVGLVGGGSCWFCTEREAVRVTF
jgi:hypothetical protein